MASGTTGTLTWDFNESTGVFAISGSGAMDDYSRGADVPWVDINSNITSIEINEGVTHIGSYSFTGCDNESNTTLIIPRSVVSIGVGAFSLCDKVTSIYFKGNKPTMGKSSFMLALLSFPKHQATVYTTGWGSDEVFTSGSDSVLGSYTILTYATWTPPSTSPKIPVNVSGTWKSSTPYVNVNGTWKEVIEVYINVNGTWKEVV